jgi:hypothetical protein
MQYILLLGAGFSRNWGGWLASEAFEYLLGCPEISRNSRLQAVLWRNQPTGGFEHALAEIQAESRRDPEAKNHLDDLQNAVARMFNDMNRGFFDTAQFEFQNFRPRTVRTFLTRFNAIFTLNQDLLLEHYYIDNDVSLLSDGRWNGSELPGMRRIPNSTAANPISWAQLKWTPGLAAEFKTDTRLQPYFKLHGSSNWQETTGGAMLIMGGNKVREIGLSPVLSWYHQQLEERLSLAETRLMVIGYGFRDPHINEVITRAVTDRGLRMFVIAPEGGDLARTVNPTHAAPLRRGTELEAAFERGLIGASRRSLREIFGNDTIEHNKVLRFFEA